MPVELDMHLNMQLPTSSPKFNTDGRTDGLTKMKIAEDIILAVVTARGAAKNGEFCA